MKIKSLGGRGEPLLMIHGWGVNSEIWTSLVDELKLFVTVYVVDLPGMGGSSSISPYTLDNISKEIKANVPIKKCNILGWSLGGQVAMYLAIKMPEFVEKLILMSTTPCFVEKIDWPYGVNKQFFLNFENIELAAATLICCPMILLHNEKNISFLEVSTASEGDLYLLINKDITLSLLDKYFFAVFQYFGFLFMSSC